MTHCVSAAVSAYDCSMSPSRSTHTCHFHYCLDACLLISVDFINTDVVFAITCGGELRHGESNSWYQLDNHKLLLWLRNPGFDAGAEVVGSRIIVTVPYGWTSLSILISCKPSKGGDANARAARVEPYLMER
jgi:hypothetical protein